MKNVVVYLKEVPGESRVSSDVAIIDQIDCHYVPHVTAIAAGQKVIFKSSDPTIHNVHLLGNASNTGNFAMPTPGNASPRTLTDVEFTRVKCDVHPWMTCWIAVIDGPYFAVTDDKGEFEIKNVPAGAYTLNAWHELFQPQTASVTVAPDKAAEDEMLNEYDFSHGIRGKYARRYAQGANVVVLEPDVAKVVVIDALQLLGKLDLLRPVGLRRKLLRAMRHFVEVEAERGPRRQRSEQRDGRGSTVSLRRCDGRHRSRASLSPLNCHRAEAGKKLR